MAPSNRQSASPALSRGALAVAVSALAGVLAAGLVFPLVGGIALAAQSGADSFESLPSELKVPPLPQRSRDLLPRGATPVAVGAAPVGPRTGPAQLL